MNAPHRLIAECQRRGIKLRPRGNQLWIEPEELTTPELIQQLRQHKFSIIAALESRRQTAALHMAKQVFLLEFSDCNPDVFREVANELACHSHPLCQRAIAFMHGRDVK